MERREQIDARTGYCIRRAAPRGASERRWRRLRGRPSFDRDQNPSEELPYKVELWNTNGTSVDLILAVTASPSIGYAAYYAATCEHPNRQITLRHKNSIISRWPGPGH